MTKRKTAGWPAVGDKVQYHSPAPGSPFEAEVVRVHDPALVDLAVANVGEPGPITHALRQRVPFMQPGEAARTPKFASFSKEHERADPPTPTEQQLRDASPAAADVAPQVDVVADAAALAVQSKLAESQPMPTAPGPVAPVEPFVPPPAAKADKPKRERKPRAPAKPRARTKH